LSTWKCLQHVLVCSLGSHTFKWLVGGVFITSPTIIAVGHKVDCSIVARTKQPGAHRTCPVPWPLQPTVEVYSSRPLDPTVTIQSGAHRIVRCYSDRESLVAGSLLRLSSPTSDSPVPIGHVLFTFWCSTITLVDCFIVPFGLLLFLSLGLLRNF
jgi:hypothetical protein